MRKAEAGFSYLDTMVGLTILMMGLAGLAGTIVASVVRSRQQEQQLLAKQYATSTMESIISARDIKVAGLTNGWDSIGNVGSNIINGAARGIFVTGQQPVKTGVGTDQVIGTADDNGTIVPELTREIIIEDLCDPARPSFNCSPPGTNPVMMRRITVNIKYWVGRVRMSESVVTTLTNYSY